MKGVNSLPGWFVAFSERKRQLTFVLSLKKGASRFSRKYISALVKSEGCKVNSLPGWFFPQPPFSTYDMPLGKIFYDQPEQGVPNYSSKENNNKMYSQTVGKKQASNKHRLVETYLKTKQKKKHVPKHKN